MTPMSSAEPARAEELIIDLPNSPDQESILQLRAELQRCESVNARLGIPASSWVVNPRLASVHPSQLPACFLVAGSQLEQLLKETSGWKQIGTTPFAVRDMLASDPSPRFIGVKRELRYQCNRNKKKRSSEIMTLYQLLRVDNGLLAIVDTMALCKISHHNGEGQFPYQSGAPLHPASTSAATIPRPIAPSFPEEAINTFTNNPLDAASINSVPAEDNIPMPYSPTITDLLQEYPTETSQDLSRLLNSSDPEENTNHGDVPPSSSTGRGRRSEVWKHYTTIHGKGPKEVYAACHCCHMVLKGQSRKNGTTRLRKHAAIHGIHIPKREVARKPKQQNPASSYYRASTIPSYLSW